MKKKALALLVGILAVIFTSSLAFSQGGPTKPTKKGKKQGLKLSTEQQEQIKKIRHTFQKKVIQQRAEIQLKELDLRELVESQSPNEKEIEKNIDELHRLQAELQKLEIRQMLAVKKILTPEQQKALENKMKQKKMQFHEKGMMKKEKQGKKGMKPGMEGPGMQPFFEEDPLAESQNFAPIPEEGPMMEPQDGDAEDPEEELLDPDLFL